MSTVAATRPVTTWRPMTIGDLDAVMAIEVTAYAHPWSRGNFTDTLVAGHFARVLTAADGSLLGYVVAMDGVDEVHLLNLTVAPAAQGCGHARGMLDALTQDARARGLGEVWLEVRASNDRARRLYRQYGFEEVGSRRAYYPDGHGRREDAVLMSLRLAPPDAGRPVGATPVSTRGATS